YAHFGSVRWCQRAARNLRYWPSAPVEMARFVVAVAEVRTKRRSPPNSYSPPINVCAGAQLLAQIGLKIERIDDPVSACYSSEMKGRIPHSRGRRWRADISTRRRNSLIGSGLSST